MKTLNKTPYRTCVRRPLVWQVEKIEPKAQTVSNEKIVKINAPVRKIEIDIFDPLSRVAPLAA